MNGPLAAMYKCAPWHCTKLLAWLSVSWIFYLTLYTFWWTQFFDYLSPLLSIEKHRLWDLVPKNYYFQRPAPRLLFFSRKRAPLHRTSGTSVWKIRCPAALTLNLVRTQFQLQSISPPDPAYRRWSTHIVSTVIDIFQLQYPPILTLKWAKTIRPP